MVLRTVDGKILKIRKATTAEREHKEFYATLQIPMEVMMSSSAPVAGD